MKLRSEVVLRLPLLGITILALTINSTVGAASFDETQQHFFAGDYAWVIRQAREVLKKESDDEGWNLLLSKALLATGRYAEANEAMTNVLAEDSRSIQLRWQAREVFQLNGRSDAAHTMVEEIVRTVSRRPWDYRDAPSLVIFGQAALVGGADPKRVLDQLFDAAKKANPKLREVYLASGELALAKHDFALAARRFEEALKQLPDDPDLHYGLARAFEPSHQALMLASLDAALERNSNHVGSLLVLTEHNIDGEDYEAAEKLLDQVNTINPWRPEAWAYRAVLAHLDNKLAEEKSCRSNGLKFWADNPRVDHLIGLKLSQKYRFAEGAEYQRQALRFDPDFLPAKAQLAQDLLRLGDEKEGWQLAQEVQKEDGYDVAAYNLAGLHDTMAKFEALTNEHFLIRMSGHEAKVYGTRVLQLLEEARGKLCSKYGTELQKPTIVEIFPEQKDFAVRTFGMPGNPGYLGVCFGRVVTANSPASQKGNPVNWEAVLWHEFCHVVTLQLTRNKMPRWLSEGISVYEEIQANPAWGQRMSPRYREMILGDDLTPLSKLSAAFLAPPSEMHLQFAYYESSLAVEFLMTKFGLEPFKTLLRDLAEGAEINAAIEKRFAPMTEIEPQFEAFARERARKLAPGLDWDQPQFAKQSREGFRRRYGISVKVPPKKGGDTNAPGKSASPPKPLAPSSATTWAEWAHERPTNFYVMTTKAEQLIEDKQWSEAKPVLEQLVKLYPESTGSDSAYAMLASAHRALGETNQERVALAALAERDDEATDAYARLMQLAAAAQDWSAVTLNARRYLAVNPLVAPPHRFLAEASEKTSDFAQAIASYRALLELDPSDPGEMHFRLARLLARAGDAEAKRHVLQALEEAPRNREALRLLLKLNQAPAASEPAPSGGGGEAGQ